MKKLLLVMVLTVAVLALLGCNTLPQTAQLANAVSMLNHNTKLTRQYWEKQLLGICVNKHSI